MTTGELKKLKDAQPFRPFDIHLADGRSVRVEHPDFLAYAGGRTALIGYPDGDFEIVDLLLVTSLKVIDEADTAAEPRR
jgi:hypothetical protein